MSSSDPSSPPLGSSRRSSTSSLSRSPPTIPSQLGSGPRALSSSSSLTAAGSPLSARGTAKVSNGSSALAAKGSPASSKGGGKRGTTGGGGGGGELSELGDEELRRFSREELIRMLRGEWEKGEKHQLQVNELTQARDILQESNDEINHRLAQHTQTEDDLEIVTARAESEMANKLEVMAKLRERVSELEREKRETDKRHADQTLSFEAERQALYDSEQHLKSRLVTLSRRQQPSPLHTSSSNNSLRTSSPSPSPTSSNFPSDEQLDAQLTQLKSETLRLIKLLKAESIEKEDLRRDLETSERAFSSLQEALDRTREEMGDLKGLNQGLQEEIESYSLLLVERTISGKMGNNELLSRSYLSSDNLPPPQPLRSGSPTSDDEWTYNQASDRQGGGRASLGSVHEESELDPELVGEQSGSERGAEELDPEFGNAGSLGEELEAAAGTGSEEEGDVRRTPRAGLKPKLKGGKEKVERVLKGAGVLGGAKKERKGEVLGEWAVTGSGLDLAAELGRAEEGVEEGGLRKLEKGEDGEALRAEVKALKDANKALTLYCSKILDRIMSIDGFEEVLSSDNGNSLQNSVRRAVSGASSIKKPSPARRSAQDVSNTISLANTPVPPPDNMPTPPAIIASFASSYLQRPAPVANTRLNHGKSQSVSVLPSFSSFNPQQQQRSEFSQRESAPKVLPSIAATVAADKKARPTSIDWKGGIVNFFSASPSSSPVVSSAPIFEDPPVVSNGKLKPLRLSTAPVSPPRDSRNLLSPALGRRVDVDEEFEEEEDRLQRERVELLQKQIQLEDEEPSSHSTLGMGRPSSTLARSSSSHRLSNSSTASTSNSSSFRSVGVSPLGHGSPRQSLVEKLGENEDVQSYFPQLSSPPGLIDGAEVTEEMVSLRLATLDSQERLKASEISSGRGGGYSLPSRSNSISSRRLSLSAREVGVTSSEEKEWLGGGNGRKGSVGAGATGAGETLFHYPEEED